MRGGLGGRFTLELSLVSTNVSFRLEVEQQPDRALSYERGNGYRSIGRRIQFLGTTEGSNEYRGAGVFGVASEKRSLLPRCALAVVGDRKWNAWSNRYAKYRLRSEKQRDDQIIVYVL